MKTALLLLILPVLTTPALAAKSAKDISKIYRQVEKKYSGDRTRLNDLQKDEIDEIDAAEKKEIAALETSPQHAPDIGALMKAAQGGGDMSAAMAKIQKQEGGTRIKKIEIGKKYEKKRKAVYRKYRNKRKGIREKQDDELEKKGLL